MSKFILRLYDYFKGHKVVMTLVLVVLTLVLGLLVTRVNYKEDITDFLPLDGNKQEAMRVFQNMSGANRIIAIIGSADNRHSVSGDSIVGATDAFTNAIAKEKTHITSNIDIDQVAGLAAFVYNNIPYFLTSGDYRRMDSLLSNPDYVQSQLNNDMEMLLFPSGGMLSDNISRDPLNLFTPVVEQLSSGSLSLNYELYDGHIFTPDMKKAVVLIDSPYGSSETEQNGKLIERLGKAADSIKSQYKNVDIHLTGGPVIAVDNASTIKTDSIFSVIVAVTLIMALLFLSLRSFRNISLIFLTIAWGWLFALGCLSIVHDNISLIVIGISSIIIGIAVNYPLHLVAHLNHTPDIKKALKEIVQPLLVGNITTIGAFLALVPLKSIALRDLGLFASLLLIGTIAFVFAFLPHFVKVSQSGEQSVFSRLGNIRLENKNWLVGIAAVLTLIFACFSLRTSFDPNISHINYMSDEQKSDMNCLSGLLRSNPSEKTVYAVASGNSMDEALKNNERLQPVLESVSKSSNVKSVHTSAQFLVSKEEQARRLSRWHQFINKYGDRLKSELVVNGEKSGFASDSFNDFFKIMDSHYTVKDNAYFIPLTTGPFRQNVYYDKQSKHYGVMTPIVVKADKAKNVIDSFNSQLQSTKAFSFEISQLNSSIAESLSDNFNYIGWVCSLIVFFFLWVSMGNIELAALSFLPMAVSWLWILGLMSIFGIQFNIINIILATFIFGQGDDYTIFMTEGCQYEYAYGKKMLASYKNSIIISALIMFIGMGVLVFAKHPALRSLGSVTLVGMFSVVLMAYLLPPFFFKWITSKNGKLRKRPLTIKSLLMPRRYPQEIAEGKSTEYYTTYIRDVYYYCGIDIVKKVRNTLTHYNNYIVSDTDSSVVVSGGSYGAVALLLSLMNPKKTITFQAANEDDADVCKNVACRVSNNIKVERAEHENK